MSRYHKLLFALFAAVWIWAAIAPSYRHDWLLENYLVFIFVPIIIVVGRYFKLSNLSYTLITLFMCMHVVGSHYTYAEVPFGVTLQHWFGSSRNMYDRLVHFSFGLLMAYPLREVFHRVARARTFWGFWLPVELVLAFSALYEIIEWLVAADVNPSAGLAFLGAQGDIWDAQKDMLVAGIGAVVAMLIAMAIRWALDGNFPRDLRQSFIIDRDDRPLGEVEFRRLWRNRANKNSQGSARERDNPQ
jgi:putative membrane protein